jgi:nicotinate-nucleotide adenylyltransferase
LSRLRRVGIFGGTFDPPHLGHLVVAEAARESLRLERVLFVPSGTPPHKRDRRISPAEDRVAMTRLATRGHPAFSVSTLETRRGGASYTVDTLRLLAVAHPGARFHLIIGQDSLDEFHTWHEPEEILRLAVLAVARRPDTGPRRRVHPRARRRGTARRVVWIEAPLIGISSSGLRARARRGASLRYLVPPSVEAYLRRRRLYVR